MTEPAGAVTVGAYLAARLAQLGCRHLFGLPGDFNMNLLDEMLATGDLGWQGGSNELDAAYAADGYARVGRAVGAVVTTYGVGELSAVNGIAGSFAEDVPVVQITGLPSTEAIRTGARLHHTLLDGDYLHFARMFREVTVAQAILDRADPAGEIDRVLAAMLASSKPVYLGVPLDIALAPVAAERLRTPLAPPASDPEAVAAFADALRDRLARMDRLTVLAGPGVHRRGLEASVAALAEAPGIRIASQVGSKAILDETHPASLGTYLGRNTLHPGSQAVVDDAGVLVMVGTVYSDVTTGHFSHRYQPGHAIEIALDHARIGPAVYPGVRLEDGLGALSAVVGELAFAPQEDVAATEPVVVTAGDDEALDQATMWALLERWMPSGTTLVADMGTAFFGAVDLTLPEHSDLLGQPVWSSIGYTLPAAWGAAVARPDRRPVLIIGDGSAQLTIAELGRLLTQPSAPVMLLLDNGGYTVERRIQSPEAVYQDIPAWDWTALPAALGAAGTVVHDVATPAALREALAAASDPGRSHFLRVRLHRDDAPRLLLALAAGIAEVNAAV